MVIAWCSVLIVMFAGEACFSFGPVATGLPADCHENEFAIRCHVAHAHGTHLPSEHLRVAKKVIGLPRGPHGSLKDLRLF